MAGNMKSKAIEATEKLEKSVLLSTPVTVAAMIVPEVSVGQKILKTGTTAVSKLLKSTQSVAEKQNQELDAEIEGCLKDTFTLLAQTRNAKKVYSINDNEEDQLVALMEAYQRKSQSERQVEDVAELGSQLRDILGNERSARMQNDFSAAFRSCLFHYPVLNAALTAARVDELSDQVLPIIDFVGNEFLNKIGVLYNRDGMMRCFYDLFANYLITHRMSSATGKYLARVQDEYNTEYLQYNSHARGSKSYANGLINILISPEKTSVQNENDPLIDVYLQFVHADCMYFQGRHLSAIDEYKKVLEAFKKLRSRSAEDVMDQVDTYLRNSIGWSYHLGGKNKQGMECCRELFSEKEFSDSYPFIWRYRRNYGVCLENEGKFSEAAELYQQAIDTLPEDIDEYKIYVTYCSALMKYWDDACGKLQGNWQNQAVSVLKNGEGLLSAANIDKIKAYLSIAQEKGNMFSDVYVQRVKVLTYELLLSEEDQIGQIKKAVLNELLILDTIASGQGGRRFVRRDFYLAMCLKEKRKDKKLEWFQKCIEANENVKNGRDYEDFKKMLSRLAVLLMQNNLGSDASL